MNEKMKKWLPVLVLAIIAVVVECSSPLCLWANNSFTDMQNSMYDIAHQIREGYLAYVEVDGNYGPVVYELLGLGYLPTETHVVHFIEELIIIFASLLALYHTSRFYASEIMSVIAASVLMLFGWGAFTAAGAEEILFPLLALGGYHIVAQLRNGYAGQHTYLLAVELGLIFFAQPGYICIWVGVLIMFAIIFKKDGIEKDQYKRFFASILEGLVTVAIPMVLYLLYFKNAKEFFANVVAYNFAQIGSFGEGMAVVLGTPWIIALVVFIVLGIFTFIKNGQTKEYVGWLIFSALVIVVISLQGGNYASFRVLSKVMYIVPIALVGGMIDKMIGLNQEV